MYPQNWFLLWDSSNSGLWLKGKPNKYFLYLKKRKKKEKKNK